MKGKKTVSFLLVFLLIMVSISPIKAYASLDPESKADKSLEYQRIDAMKGKNAAILASKKASEDVRDGLSKVEYQKEQLKVVEYMILCTLAEQANVAKNPKATAVDRARVEKSLMGYEGTKRKTILDIRTAELNVEVLKAEKSKKIAGVQVAETKVALILQNLNVITAQSHVTRMAGIPEKKAAALQQVLDDCNAAVATINEVKKALEKATGQGKKDLEIKLADAQSKLKKLGKEYTIAQGQALNALFESALAKSNLAQAEGSLLWAAKDHKKAKEQEYAAELARETLTREKQEAEVAAKAAKDMIGYEVACQKQLCDAKCTLELANDAAKAAVTAAEKATGKNKATALATVQEAEKKVRSAQAAVEQATDTWNEGKTLAAGALVTLENAISKMHAPTPPPSPSSEPIPNPTTRPDPKPDPRPDPKPDPKPISISGIDTITGTAHTGVQLTAGTVTPAAATVAYQWQIGATADGAYTAILGENTNRYTVKAEDAGKFIRVMATGTGGCTNSVVSACVGPVSSMALSKVTATHYLGEVDEEIVTVTMVNTTLDCLEVSGNPLLPNTDYTVSGNQVTLNASYMNRLPQGNTVIGFKGSDGVLCPFTLHISGAMLAADPIANGAINPSTLAGVTGGSFTASAEDPAQWDIDTGTTGLVVQSIAFHGLGTSRAVTISFTGIANTGVIKIRPKGSSLAGGVSENEVQIIVPAARTTSLKSYNPVVFSQAGDILNNTVQYKTAAAVIAALPSTISVLLDDDVTRVDVPVIWTDTDSYRSDTSKWYTFTGTWGTMPTGANNDNNLPAPTVEVYVAMMP